MPFLFFLLAREKITRLQTGVNPWGTLSPSGNAPSAAAPRVSGERGFRPRSMDLCLEEAFKPPGLPTPEGVVVTACQAPQKSGRLPVRMPAPVSLLPLHPPPHP